MGRATDEGKGKAMEQQAYVGGLWDGVQRDVSPERAFWLAQYTRRVAAGSTDVVDRAYLLGMARGLRGQVPQGYDDE